MFAQTNVSYFQGLEMHYSTAYFESLLVIKKSHIFSLQNQVASQPMSNKPSSSREVQNPENQNTGSLVILIVKSTRILNLFAPELHFFNFF